MILEELLDCPEVGEEMLDQIGKVVNLVTNHVFAEDRSFAGLLNSPNLLVNLLPFAGKFPNPGLRIRIDSLSEVLHLQHDPIETRLGGGISPVLHGKKILQPTERLFRMSREAKNIFLLFLVVYFGQVTVFLVAPLVQVFLGQAFGSIEIFEFPHLLDVFGEGCSEFLFGSLHHPPMLEGFQEEAHDKRT